ncbi:MAG TPA: alpha/beta hydrolase, partial [Candidatus Dormibacteraeota bacterium]|nr:alpha/beta hydrolase [Candidatus Dormibacteraeota bacterium]
WGQPSADQPSLLLLHGLSSNSRFWERTVARLPGRHVVALDQRSHGLSDRPLDRNHNPTFVADAHALAGRLGLQRPVVAGHSWGATIALEYAAAHPEATGGLSIMDGPVWTTRMRWDDVKDFVQPPFPLHTTLEDAYRAQARYIPGAWGDDLKRFVEAGLVREDGGWRSTLTVPVRYDILRDMFGADTERLWGAVRSPVSILLAQNGPPDFVRMKEEGAKELHAHLPSARIRWFDTPHDIPLYEPAEVATELEALSARRTAAP